MEELKTAFAEAKSIRGDFAEDLNLQQTRNSTLGNTSSCDTENCTPSNVDACKI